MACLIADHQCHLLTALLCDIQERQCPVGWWLVGSTQAQQPPKSRRVLQAFNALQPRLPGLPWSGVKLTGASYVQFIHHQMAACPVIINRRQLTINHGTATSHLLSGWLPDSVPRMLCNLCRPAKWPCTQYCLGVPCGEESKRVHSPCRLRGPRAGRTRSQRPLLQEQRKAQPVCLFSFAVTRVHLWC